MKRVFARKQRLEQRPLDEILEHTLPNALRPYLLNFDLDRINLKIVYMALVSYKK